ncbi:MAG TPA: ECF transporter S component [Anaerolineae bacterium]|nr:ECF transporter S component [Anaerolineae bacterium]
MKQGQQRTDWIGALIIGLATVAGVAAFVYPFFLPALPARGFLAHQEDALAVLALLTTLCLGAVLAELTSGRMSARTIAAMGVLAAVNGALRLAETTLVALPGGFSPVFFLILLCGYVFGPRFGFLYGILSLLVSAMVTGGVGPWLPYQMFTSGWVGMSAGWLRAIPKPGSRTPRAGWGFGTWDLGILSVFGFTWGLLYGVIINLYFWPYAVGAAGGGWEAGSGVLEALKRYAVFYGATSLWWDLARAVGNVLLVVAFGLPVLRILRRFQRRFRFEVVPEWASPGPATPSTSDNSLPAAEAT